MRPMSDLSPILWRVRTYPSACSPMQRLPPGGQVELYVLVADRLGDAEVHPANRVHHALEAGEINRDEVVDVDAGERFHGLPGAADTAEAERRVYHAETPLLTRPPFPGAAGWKLDQRVAREADHRRLVPCGGQVHEHDDVRTLPGVPVVSLVRPDDEDVQRVGRCLGRAGVAQILAGDFDVTDVAGELRVHGGR